MKRSLVTLTLALVLLTLAAAPAAATSPAWPQPTTFATLPYGDMGSFAESLAADRCGNLYASLTVYGADTNTGQIWRITPRGDTVLAAEMDVGYYGMLSGLAFDAMGRLYVGYWDFNPDPAVAVPGVFRVGAGGSLSRVLTLPAGSLPNGLAFHAGLLYVSDSAFGAIWRARPGANVTLATPWLQSDLLAPAGAVNWIGANGIAFRRDSLFVAVSDPGLIVRVPLLCNGSAGTPKTVCDDPALASADGIAFDVLGGLWICTDAGTTGSATGPSGGLLRLAPDGSLRQIAEDPGWLNYPVQPVFGTSWRTGPLLYVLNGAYYGYEDGTSPTVEALHVGVPGVPLP